MKINTQTKLKTHEGAIAKRISVEQELRRTLMSCLLWEKSFYESGEDVATRIMRLADQCDKELLSALAVEARTVFKLRHAPLLILLALVKKGGKGVAEAIENTINRPDEITELLALYWKDGKRPLSKQLKLGLSKAFLKFNEYQLAKWNRPGDIKLRDCLFLVHGKPTKDKEELFKKLANNELETPNTWESRMAGGGNKKDVFTDLLKTNKLGYMALLRNLRGMNEAGVDHELIRAGILKPSAAVLPFRFLSAAKYAPMFERELDGAMMMMLDSMERIKGKTVLLVDVSGSMTVPLSSKSDLSRIDAASSLAILLSGICENIRVLCFGTNLGEAPPRQGMALGDAIRSCRLGHATNLGASIGYINSNIPYDRLICITDEQSRDSVPDPKGKAYVINVASEKNGVGYGSYCHIDGMSEACVDFIQEHERTDNL